MAFDISRVRQSRTVKAGTLTQFQQFKHEGEWLEIMSVSTTKLSIILECKPVAFFGTRRRIVLRKSDDISVLPVALGETK